MKINLYVKNFRRFDEATFNFEDYSSTLIVGRSGAGKSSIFMAISFAMTGDGKKIVKFGKSNCVVKLTINDELTIDRRKGPGRLLVTVIKDGTRYEDSVAENVIKTRYPDWELGYMKQTCSNSIPFLSMPPMQKATMLERIVFGNDDAIGKINKCVKELIGERKSTLNDRNVERRTTESILVKTVGRCDKKDYDLLNDDALLSIDEKALEKKLFAARDRKSKLTARRQLEDDLKNTYQRQSTDDTASDIAARYDSVESIDRELNAWKIYANNAECAREIANLRSKCDVATSKRDEISRDIPSKQIYDDIVVGMAAYKKRESMQKEIDKLKRYILNTLTCPSCGSKIKCTLEGELILEEGNDDDRCDKNNGSNNSNKDAKELRSRLDSLIGAVASCSEKCDRVPKEYSEIAFGTHDDESSSEYLSSVKRKLDSIERLDDECKKIKRNIDIKESTIKRGYDNPPAICESLLIEMKNEMIRKRERDRILRKLGEIKEGLINSVEETETDEKCYDDIIVKLQSDAARIKRANVAKQWMEIDALDSELKELQKSVDSANKLKEFVSVAKNETFRSAIRTINDRAKMYCGKFFSNNDIDVAILLGSDDNNKIALRIEMDGIETDPNCLSGGEYARVSLAFTLAFVEFCDTRVLFLDEILAPLDEETTNRVISIVKKYFKGTFICISHQVVRGIFDSVVNIE